ncbi:S41 family peptidase [Pedobacter sp.]|uniref:S41 family peptidase n=1 Tax=Pedobacter sp. TaxID=1411316 RepID=UPI003D7F8161
MIVDSVKSYLDKSLLIIEANALNSKNVNWKELRQHVYNKASGAKRYEDILPIYPYIFEQIDDHHGSLKYKNKTYSWNKNDGIKVNQTIKSATKKYSFVRSEKIGKDIGYILIPGNNDFRGQLIDSISRDIKNAIAKINDKNIKGWIIDLRVNTGGNMYPMIAGLTEFIGEGRVGGFITPALQPDGDWIIKNGTFYVDSVKVSPVKYKGHPIKKDVPVAILISSYTASSGEMTAITTIGRYKSILIGEPTAGYTTTNLGFKLNEYSGLNLAVDYAADRNGKIYPENINPDILVSEGDNFEVLHKDQKVKKAIAWIRKNR